jgi:hypothetical protein
MTKHAMVLTCIIAVTVTPLEIITARVECRTLSWGSVAGVAAQNNPPNADLFTTFQQKKELI